MSISIKDISKLAGVSTATVSRVLNNTGKVSPKTEAQVKDVIARYGYTPNMIAKGLRTNMIPSVGIIVPDIVNEPYGFLVRTVQQQLLSHGIISTICNTNDNEETTQQYIKILRSQYVSGIIYVPDSHHEGIHFGDLPVVYIERRPSHSLPPNSAIIESDDKNGGYLAAKELLDKGCRDIAIYMDPFGLSSFANRYLGHCDALKEYGIKPKTENIIYVDPLHSTDVIKKTEALIEHGFRFDGVICTSNRITTGVLTALVRKGIIRLDRLNQSAVKLVGYEDLRISEYGLFPVTTVAIETEKMAIEAVDALVSLLAGRQLSKQEYMLPVHIIRRETT